MNKKNNKGFTLTEIIAALVILGVIVAIAIPSVGGLQRKFRNSYYNKLDKTVLAAGMMYYKNNSESNPDSFLGADDTQYNNQDSSVDNPLIDDKYIDSINQYNSDTPCEGRILAVKLNDEYKYVNCMKCGSDYQNYSDLRSPEARNSIDVSDSSSALNRICNFLDSDAVYRSYVPLDKFLYLGNYSNKEIENELCLNTVVIRAMSDDYTKLYEETDKSSDRLCPSNLSAVDINTAKTYKVKYENVLKNVSGSKNVEDETVQVVVYQHAAPILITDNLPYVGGVYYVKGSFDIALAEADKTTFKSPYKSTPDGFKYTIDGSTWSDPDSISADKFRATIKISEATNEYKFRIMGKGTGTNKEEPGKISSSYKIDSHKYTLTLNKNGGTGGKTGNESDDTYDIWKGYPLETVQAPTRDGYRFEGYFDASDEMYYNPDGSVAKNITVSGNISLKAKWTSAAKPEPTFDLFVNDINYNRLVDGDTVNAGARVFYSIVVYSPKRELGDHGLNTTKTGGKEYSTIYLNFNDGKGDIACHIDEDEDFFKNAVIYDKTKNTRFYCGSYEFEDKENPTSKLTKKVTTRVEYQKTSTELVALTPVSVTITLPIYYLYYVQGTGETVSCTTEKKYSGSKWKADCQSATKTGYNITDWTDRTGSTSHKNETVTGTVYAYAKWTPKTFTITFNPNGGSLTSSSACAGPGFTYSGGTCYKVVTYDSTYGVLPSVKRTGSAFNGWYINGTKISPTGTVNITEDSTAYANWISNESTLIVDNNNGESTLSYQKAAGTKITLTLPTKSYTSGGSFKYTATFDYNGGSGSYSSKDFTHSAVTYYSFNSWTKSSPFYGTLSTNGTEYTFSSNNGVTSTITAYYDSYASYSYGSITLPSATKSDGSTFKGWRDPVSGNLLSANSPYGEYVWQNVTLVAEWEAPAKVEYTVKYHENFSSNEFIDTFTCSIDNEVCDISSPYMTRYGYNRIGWAYESTATEPFYNNPDVYLRDGHPVEPDDVIHIYAVWKAKDFTVTFNPNGGTVSPTSKTVTYEDIYGDLPVPTRDGYIFTGWTDKYNQYVSESDNYDYAYDTTLSANWQLIYNDAPEVKIYAMDSEYNVYKSSTEILVGKYNYFISVEKKDYLTGTVRAKFSDTNGNSSSIQCSHTNDVFYNLVGVDIDKEILYNCAYKTYDRHDIYGAWAEVGYYNTVENSTNAYSNRLELQVKGTHLFYYDETQQYGAGECNPGYKEGLLGQPWGTLCTARAKSGYTFKGWYTTSNTLVTAASISNESTTNVHKVYTQNSVAATSADVTYYSNGGYFSGNATSQVINTTYNQKYTFPSNPTKTGYTFDGWYTAASGGTKITTSHTFKSSGGTTSSSSDARSLYAHWTQKQITVTFKRNSTTSDTASTSHTYYYETDNQTLSNYSGWTKTGYDLLGWAESASSTTAKYSVNNKVTKNWIDTNAPSKTLYGVWGPKSAKITYNKNNKDNSATELRTYPYNVSNQKIENMGWSRSGYTFLGWSTNASAHSASYSVGEAIPSDWLNNGKSITLYAIWEKTITIKFNYNKASWNTNTTRSCKIYNKETQCKITTPSIPNVTGTNKRNEVKSGYGFSPTKAQDYKELFNIKGWNTDKAATNRSVGAEAEMTVTTSTEKEYFAIVTLNYNEFTAFPNSEYGLYARKSSGTSYQAKNFSGMIITNVSSNYAKITGVTNWAYHKVTGSTCTSDGQNCYPIWVKGTNKSGTTCSNGGKIPNLSPVDCKDKWYPAAWLSWG